MIHRTRPVPASAATLLPPLTASPSRRRSWTARLGCLIVAGLATVAVSACADGSASHEQSPQTTAAQPMNGPGAMAGMWQVTSVHPSGMTPLPPEQQEALEGRMVTLSPHLAEDLDGRQCHAPAYQFTTLPQSMVFGYRQAMPLTDSPVTEMTVFCHGSPFARVIKLASGVMMAQHHGTWAALQTAPMPSMATPQLSTPMAMEHHTMSGATGRMSDGKEAHLASYRSEGMAREGWGIYRHRYPMLKDFQPRFEKVSLGAKGTFVRLMAMGGNAQALCQSLSKQGAYCRVMKAK